MRSDPPKLSEVDTLSIASSAQLLTSSEQLSDSLEQPPPSQEVSKPKTEDNKAYFTQKYDLHKNFYQYLLHQDQLKELFSKSGYINRPQD
ncbi:hypothetical protein BpHYR1_010470 [Brachionus plicatilis]|uniref:Uncharacterized protein n=1 Tax=Brachionus plicatilis TaxID=10195 RepID=A0A3M7T0E3_BRAPC|nr:hypothetical protein BpHYR1_010470 [Brachionus plicatilis]